MGLKNSPIQRPGELVGETVYVLNLAFIHDAVVAFSFVYDVPPLLEESNKLDGSQTAGASTHNGKVAVKGKGATRAQRSEPLLELPDGHHIAKPFTGGHDLEVLELLRGGGSSTPSFQTETPDAFVYLQWNIQLSATNRRLLRGNSQDHGRDLCFGSVRDEISQARSRRRPPLKSARRFTAPKIVIV